jgi:hypothetical protein
MQRIDDPRFLRKFCRLLSWPSRHLDGSPILVHDTRSPLEIHITNGLCSLVGIAWVNRRAVLLPGSSWLHPGDLDELDVAFSSLVRRLLHKHGLLDRAGASTRRGAA